VAPLFKFSREQKDNLLQIMQKYKLSLAFGTERRFTNQLERAVREVLRYRESTISWPAAKTVRRRLAQFADGIDRSFSRLDRASLDALRASELEGAVPFFEETERAKAMDEQLQAVRELSNIARRAAKRYAKPSPNDDKLLIELVRRTFERFYGRKAGRSVRFDTKKARRYESGAFFELVRAVAEYAGLELPSADRVREMIKYRDTRKPPALKARVVRPTQQ
jgi:hypothetical protein